MKNRVLRNYENKKKKRDKIYKKFIQTVKKKNIRFLSQLRIKIFILKCSLNENNKFFFYK